jgi:metal-responsive CopG/Arc/MetJ family transcriptional regulator
MASKVKVTLSLDESLVKELEGVSRQSRTTRSRLVEEALRFWRRSRLEQQLKEGYQHMAKEDRTTAEGNLAAGWEIVK